MTSFEMYRDELAEIYDASDELTGLIEGALSEDDYSYAQAQVSKAIRAAEDLFDSLLCLGGA